jgi:membrane fusion protein (multidrug efflux system)
MVSDIQVKEAEAAYNAARGAVSQSTSSIESAKINLNFSTIKAPVSGFIGRFNYRLGSLMTPGNQEPITLLSDIHQVYTYFSLSENDFNNFQKQYAGSSIDEVIKIRLQFPCCFPGVKNIRGKGELMRRRTV